MAGLGTFGAAGSALVLTAAGCVAKAGARPISDLYQQQANVAVPTLAFVGRPFNENAVSAEPLRLHVRHAKIVQPQVPRLLVAKDQVKTA